jgi:NADH-quinone oxidoreductase subunit E/NADP-reducing hydrogenase subunit HndA
MSFDLDAHRLELDRIIDREKPKGGALIPVLHQAQELCGYLPRELQEYIAESLGVPQSTVFGVVTFYSFFTTKPRGRHRIGLCLGTACYVRGNTKTLERLSQELGVSPGESTKDMRYSLEVCRCIGLCSQAPAFMVDKSVHAKVQPDQIAEILSQYK